MKYLWIVAIIFIISTNTGIAGGVGVATQEFSGKVSSPFLEVTAQESLYYEEIYNEYNQIVSEAIEQNADIKSITEEYFKTINQKPFVIHISKILGNHKSEIVFQWFDKDALILLPHIHYGPKPKTVHVRKLSSNGIEYVLIETNLLPMLRETNRVQPDEIRLYIRMAIKINKL